MHYECYWELLSHIPSLEDPNVSVRDESYEFNERFISKGQARLLKEGKKIDVSSYGLSLAQEADFLKLTFVSEASLGNDKIEDWFDEAFFETNLKGADCFFLLIPSNIFRLFGIKFIIKYLHF